MTRKTIDELTEEVRRMRIALEEIKKYNHLRNDLDAYLYHLTMWGLGEEEPRPSPVDYGLHED